MEAASAAQQFTSWEIVGNVFEVPSYYTDVLAIGIGGFGLVWCAGDAAQRARAGNARRSLSARERVKHARTRAPARPRTRSPA